LGISGRDVFENQQSQDSLAVDIAGVGGEMMFANI
jgi:hypothetical protein